MIYAEVNQKAKKIIKIYAAVNQQAKKIIKGYISIGGKAKLFFSEFVPPQGISYYGTVTSLPKNLSALASGSTSDRAVFAGGAVNNKKANNVTSYQSNKVRTIEVHLDQARSHLAGTSFNGEVVFGGGIDNRSRWVNTVDAYSATMTHRVPAGLNGIRSNLSAASNSSYALLGGGKNKTGARQNVDAYDVAYLKQITALQQGRYDAAASCVGENVLFGGGWNGNTNYNSVECFNADLTRSNAPSLSVARHNLASASNGTYCFFGGGSNGTAVDVYNNNLVTVKVTQLNIGSSQITAAKLQNYILFISNKETVSYDNNLVQKIETSLATSLRQTADLSATSAGTSCFVAGGDSAEVECYEV